MQALRATRTPARTIRIVVVGAIWKREDRMTDQVHLHSTNDDVGRLPLAPDAALEDVVSAVRDWIESAVPAAWVEAGRAGGPAAVREVRTRADYEAWYPTF
jgi:hypothetical protein